MIGFNAFKGIDKALVDGLSSNGEKISLGMHNSLLQLGSNSYTNAALGGIGAGAIYGAANGAFSYDGSIFGGAFHGAVLGGVGGAGLRFAAETYSKGAVKSGFASSKGNVFSNEWDGVKSAFKDKEGNVMGAFQTSAFKGGW